MRKVVNTFIYLFLLMVLSANAEEPLPPKAVFKPEIAQVSDKNITIHIDILPHYYLYQTQRFGVSSQNNELMIKDIALSAGEEKHDKFFGTQTVWYGGKNSAEITLSYDNPQQLKQTVLQLKYQGCLDGVICYPPQKVTLPVNLPASAMSSNGALFNKKTSDNALLSSASPVGSAKKSLLAIQKPQSQAVLSEEKAFPFVVEPTDATTLSLRFQLADGYYLYRDKMQLVAKNLHSGEDVLANVSYHNGEIHEDKFFGKQSIYRGDAVVANIYLKRPVEQLALDITFQGCAEDRICYPLMRREVEIDNGQTRGVQTLENNDIGIADQLGNTLLNHLWAGIGLLLIAGIALSFTPCVLPMLPILLGMMTNQRQVSKWRAFSLSSAYALGVAVMMAVFGLVVAKTGINVQIIFQQPLWLVLFAAIFIVMGLAMLGVFNLAMPNSVQSKVIRWQNRFQSTNIVNMFIVGALSTLVVGPCVAPPLIAILAFIATTGDSFLGAVYLFALGLGMGLPLVVFATLITRIPKAGALSKLVTRVFAMLMFGVGLWLLTRLLSGALSLALWGAFMLVLATLFWRSDFVKQRAKLATRAVACALTLIGAVWVVGGAMGNSNPLKPFTKAVTLPFQTIADSESLQRALANSEKPVMLDLYADWCVSCQEVEHFTLTNPQVATELDNYTLLKVNISEMTKAHKKLLKELDLIGPPMLLFFENSQELRGERVVGVIDKDSLLEKLIRIKFKSE